MSRNDVGQAPLLVRIVYTAAHELKGPRRRGPEPNEVLSWLRHSAVGRELTTYLDDEGGLLEMAANRLNIVPDEDVRMIAAELANAADRLRTLADAD